MTTAQLPLDRDAMRLLAEIGFMGTVTGPLPAARSLFQSLQVLRPDSTLPWIGLALSEITAGKPDEAVRLLRDEALKQHPGDAETMAFLGLVLQKAGHAAEARKVLTDVVGRRGPEAEPHVRMATKLLYTDGGAMPDLSAQLRATR